MYEVTVDHKNDLTCNVAQENFPRTKTETGEFGNVNWEISTEISNELVSIFTSKSHQQVSNEFVSIFKFHQQDQQE